MTPRQRVKTALDHKNPDRVPIGYSSTPEAKENLKKYLNITEDNKLLKRLGVDCRMVFPDYIGPKDMNGAFGILDGGKDVWGVQYGSVNNAYGGYYEIVKYPLKDIKTIEELEKYPWPKIEWFDFDSITKQIEVLEEEDEYWIAMTFSGSVFEYSWYMRGMDKFMMDMILNLDIANKIMEKLSDFWITLTTETLKAAKGRIDMVKCGDDVGGQEGMLMSLSMWREMIKPWFKKFFSIYHKLGAKTFYHSCGSIAPVIEELIEIGLDVLNPLQLSAKGFPGVKELKEKYGDRLSFNGGIDVQTILPFGTVEDIKSKTMEIINILGKDGGLILESSHAIQPDTRPENIIAMYDAALSYRY